MVSTIIRRHCDTNVGIITGAVLSANGIGGAVAAQLLTPVIFQEGNPFGYRNSYKIVTVILVIVMLLMLVLYREDKNSASKDKGKKDKTRGKSIQGLEYEQIIKKPYFYISLACVFFTGMTLQGLSGVALPHFYDIGISKATVANITSLASILLTVSKFGVGYLYDKFGIRKSLNISYTCALVSVFTIFIISNTTLGITLAFARTMFHSVAMPLETVMIPLMVNELYGTKNFEKILGIFISVNYAGFAIGSPVGNFFFDIFGNYTIAFAVFGVLMTVTTLCMQYVMKKSQTDIEKLSLAEQA